MLMPHIVRQTQAANEEVVFCENRAISAVLFLLVRETTWLERQDK